MQKIKKFLQAIPEINRQTDKQTHIHTHRQMGKQMVVSQRNFTSWVQTDP